MAGVGCFMNVSRSDFGGRQWFGKRGPCGHGFVGVNGFVRGGMVHHSYFTTGGGREREGEGARKEQGEGGQRTQRTTNNKQHVQNTKNIRRC